MIPNAVAAVVFGSCLGCLHNLLLIEHKNASLRSDFLESAAWRRAHDSTPLATSMKTYNELNTSAELLLPAVNKHLLQVHRQVAINLVEEGDDGDTQKAAILAGLRKIYRLSWILERFLSQYVIAIAGIQGEGKSTLIRELFGSQLEGYLPENLSTGEKIPVLIRSSENQKTVEAKVITFAEKRDAWEVEDRPLSAGDFERQAKDPDDHDIMLGLDVPIPAVKNFPTDISFMMLPGIERLMDESEVEDESQRRDQIWQKLVRDVLFGSQGSIIVISYDSYAKQECRDLVADVLREFSDASPIFVVTKADQNEDLAESVRRQIISEYKTNSDRVIVKGHYPAGHPKEGLWISELLPALNKYGQTKPAFRLHQMKKLQGIVDDTGRVLGRISVERAKVAIKSSSEEQTLVALMKVFDEAVSNTRKSYLQVVNDALATRKTEAVSALNKTIKDTGFFESIWNMFTGGPTSADFEELVMKCWSGEGTDRVSIKDERILILNTVSKKMLFQHAAHGQMPTLEQPAKGNELRLKSGESFDIQKDDSEQGQLLCKREVMHDIAYLMNPEIEGDCTNSLRTSLRVLPSVALQASRLFALLPDLQEGLAQGKLAGLEERLNNMGGDFDLLRSFHGRIITGIAAFCGLDVAVDGEINTIPKLIASLAPGAPAWVAQAATGAGLLAGGAMVVSTVMHQMVREKNQKIYLGGRMAQALVDGYSIKYRELFDDSMAYLRECIQERLIHRLQLEKNLARLHRLDRAVGQLDNSIHEMKNEILKNPTTVLG